MKHAFIRDELVGRCTTRMACRLLEVSPSGYYQFLQALPAPRKERRLAIERAVVRIHTESRRIYGSPKITRELPKLGLAAHRNTVSRIMQEFGIRAKYVRRYRPTTTQTAHAMRRRQIFSSVTSPQTGQTRSGCATSLTLRRMKASSISRE